MLWSEAQEQGRWWDRPWSAQVAILVILLAVLSAAAAAQPVSDDEGYDINRRGLDQLDKIHEALNRYGRIFLIVGAVVGGIALLKIINPIGLYHHAGDRLLKRAVRGVDELVKRIQKEAEERTGSEPEEEESMDGGILAGMAEIVEFSHGEEVPAYVTTVNDRMLDNIRIALTRLRRFQDGQAERYRNYMVSVLKGIKTLTEERITSGAPSSLAVDVEAYFRDENRYKAWTKLLGHLKVHGDNQEVIDTFLLFVRNIKAGRTLATPASADTTLADTAVAVAPMESLIPEQLNEETLPVIQQAAADEAKNLVALVQTDGAVDKAGVWQFELVRRQRQLHRKEDARRILEVFLNSERRAWPAITKSKMLPCRTWTHVLYMLGVETTAQLQRRIENRWLGVQEIVILQKAFLQTFAKRHCLTLVYGEGEQAELMTDMHVPQIRRESLALLRQSHETEPERFDRATLALNEAETPQQNQVRRLIEHYINHRNEPPAID